MRAQQAFVAACAWCVHMCEEDVCVGDNVRDQPALTLRWRMVHACLHVCDVNAFPVLLARQVIC